jgi:hypothetical protein
MTYYGAKELADSFRTVPKNPLIIAEDIPEAQYRYRAAPGTRSVGELLFHINNAPSLQQRIHGTERRATLDGFDFPSVMAQFLAEEGSGANSRFQTISGESVCILAPCLRDVLDDSSRFQAKEL